MENRQPASGAQCCQHQQFTEKQIREEFLPLKDRILGFEVRVSHEVAEKIRQNPKLYQKMLKGIEADMKKHPERMSGDTFIPRDE